MPTRRLTRPAKFRRTRPQARTTPRVESLEDRCVPATFSHLLGSEHVDIGLAYEDGAWDLHLHDETHDIEYAPDEALLFVAPEAKTTQPAVRREFLTCVAPAGAGSEPDIPGVRGNRGQDDITLTLKDMGPGQSPPSSGSFGEPIRWRRRNHCCRPSGRLAGGHAHLTGLRRSASMRTSRRPTLPDGTSRSGRGDVLRPGQR